MVDSFGTRPRYLGDTGPGTWLTLEVDLLVGAAFFWLERQGIDPLPGRTSIERCLIRHGLVTPQARKRKRSDYKRWERSRSIELWQMDVVGGVRLVDGSEAKIVSGIDDHSRFMLCAHVVARATARPVCDAVEAVMACHGVPEAILTDNGKVFTARSGPRPRTSALRSGLSGERDRSPAHRTSVADHDRQDRALAPDAAPPSSSTARSSPLWPTPRPSSSCGWPTTTTSGRTSRSGDAPIERFKLAAPRPGPAETTEPEVADVSTP